jgi:hypothetical protein
MAGQSAQFVVVARAVVTHKMPDGTVSTPDPIAFVDALGGHVVGLPNLDHPDRVSCTLRMTSSSGRRGVAKAGVVG